jgi:serine/threonine-protein kinase RsbW
VWVRPHVWKPTYGVLTEMHEHRLPHSAKAAPIARRLAEREAVSQVPPGRIEDFVLMVSETVSNAVCHAPPIADGSVGLRFESDEGVLRCVVTDGGGWFAPAARLTENGESNLHFGLRIIDELSSRWGITLDGVKTVWFEVEARSS